VADSRKNGALRNKIIAAGGGVSHGIVTSNSITLGGTGANE
jgi:hypothetical protein